jgi:long-chain acyl-CoA synthetase
MKNQLIDAISRSVAMNWNRKALADFRGQSFTYGELAQRIERIHILYRLAGVKPGDRIALCAKNSAEWAATFLGALTYGAVVVPLLHEFKPGNIVHLVTHSEAKLLFTEKAIADKLEMELMPNVDGVVLLGNLEVVSSRNENLHSSIEAIETEYAKSYPNGFAANDIHYAELPMDDMALINYTSGSTGNSKGVMLSYTNLWGNISFGLKQIDFLNPGDGMLSMLPLAHMYGLVFEFLFPLCKGCQITFLGRVPSPKVVLDAFDDVKPQLVITVPLVIEKIVKTRVFPALQKPMIKVLTAIPGLRHVVYNKVRNQLLGAFGGNLKQLILGGAAVSADVEEFLRKIKFPFTIGYGMTECAPLVTYEWWATQRPHSCGRVVDGMMAKIDSPDAENTPGVLLLKGPNVMQGYFKNPEATAETFTEDGWLNTGDICTIDAQGYVYIRGRKKNMILGPSGQNIYPEEIEVVLNELPYVAESIVVDRAGKIVALVHPDYDAARQQGLTDAQTEEQVKALLPTLNKLVPAYARVAEFEIHQEEFEKTPKHSIRRFLYK